MRFWAVEDGTLWALETGDGLPPVCQARVPTTFTELGAADHDELLAVMGLTTPEPIRRRRQENRRCFVLKVDGQIATYGWVTRGAEYVGELERAFHLRNDEAYIWDCATLPAYRGQRLYSAFLSQIIYRLHGEGVSRIWIGASRENRPSVRGFANAGFKHVLDLVYRRLYRLTFMWIELAPAADHALVEAAYRILIGEDELRFGPLVLGIRN